jgi:hypothetical protein
MAKIDNQGKQINLLSSTCPSVSDLEAVHTHRPPRLYSEHVVQYDHAVCESDLQCLLIG